MAFRPIETVERALFILECFRADEPELSITDISARLGIAKGTVYRFLATLAAKGYVEQDSVSKRYRLGLKVMELGRMVEAGLDVRQRALSYLHKLSEETGENVNLAVLSGAEIVYLERIVSRQFLTMSLRVGSHLPAQVSSMGKAIMAYLPEDAREEILRSVKYEALTARSITAPEALRAELSAVAQRGYALNDEELTLGLRTVAAPVFRHGGEVIAAVNVSGPTARMTDAKIGEVVIPALLRRAADISRAMGADLSRPTKA